MSPQLNTIPYGSRDVFIPCSTELPDQIEMGGSRIEIARAPLHHTGANIGKTKHELCRTLLQRFAVHEECALTADSLGKPLLYVGNSCVPVSFSRGLGHYWAAMTLQSDSIGLDYAQAEDFPTDYPFFRIFNRNELTGYSGFTPLDISMRAALLWSTKESIVKMLGVGFRHIDPKQLNVKIRYNKGVFYVLETKSNANYDLFDKKTITTASILLNSGFLTICVHDNCNTHFI
jgi:phosphopantetheinyl transferase